MDRDSFDGKTGQLTGFDHIKFWVLNAKQTAQWYCLNYGFIPFASKRNNYVVSHAVKAGEIILVFETYLKNIDEDFSNFILSQGDGVKDVAFQVDELDVLLKAAIENGATEVRDSWEEEDEYGKVRCAIIRAHGNVTHTLIERRKYNGSFLPGYREPAEWKIPMLSNLPATTLLNIDHAVTAQPMYQMEDAVAWYERTLGMHRFWSVDDTIVHSDFSGLRVTVLTNERASVKIPVVEPAISTAGGTRRAKNQIQEYLDYNGGPGIQHIAFSTDDIASSVRALTYRGVEFIRAPKTYYAQLRERLRTAPINVEENIDELERLNILLDYDENGYLLQIFTKPVQDRPTLFLEIIQRHNHQGFGAGNIKALFEAVEMEQMRRGSFLDPRCDGHA